MKKILTSCTLALFMMTAAANAEDRATSTHALNLVEACARLNKAGQIYTRLTKERGVEYEFLDTPGLSVLANMVDMHADRTGFSSRDCLSFEGYPEVMDALQGRGASRKLLFKKGQIITGHTAQELPFSAGNIYGYRCIRPDGEFEFFLSLEEMEAERDPASTDCTPLTTARVPMQWESERPAPERDVWDIVTEQTIQPGKVACLITRPDGQIYLNWLDKMPSEEEIEPGYNVECCQF